MKVVLYGASGMVGQGVLRELLLDDRIEKVLSVGRTASGSTHAKLSDLVMKDLTDYSAVREQLEGYDACMWCLGITSAGMTEEAYTKITYELTVVAAKELLAANPSGFIFNFISGGGTDSSEKGGTMWARVKGKAENALLAMPFKSATMFRPAFIKPMHGITSRTMSYRVLYVLMWPFVPLVMLSKKYATTTERLGKAMIKAAIDGAPKKVLESVDINALVGVT